MLFSRSQLSHFLFYEFTHFLHWLKNTLLFHLRYKHSVTFANRNYEELSCHKKSDNLRPHASNSIKMRPHHSQSSRENSTPSSGTSPLGSTPPGPEIIDVHFTLHLGPAQQFSIKQLLCLEMDVKCPNFKQLTKQYPYKSKQFYKGLFIFWWKKKNTWIDSSPGISTVHSLELSQLPKWRQTSLLQSNQIQYIMFKNYSL